MLVVDRRSGTGKIVDLIDLDVEWKRYVVSHELKQRLSVKMFDISLSACKEVIDAQDLVPSCQQTID
jgi:hypothetical protein